MAGVHTHFPSQFRPTRTGGPPTLSTPDAPSGPSDTVQLSNTASNVSAGIFSDIADGLALNFFNLTSKDKLAEPRQYSATVGVFDDFMNADDDGVTTHGEEVEGVIRDAGYGDEDLQRFQVGVTGPSTATGLRSKRGMRKLVEKTAGGLLDNTSQALESLVQDPKSRIRTINQSQNTSPARISQQLWNGASANPRARAALADTLGLAGDIGDRELAQGLTDQVSDIFKNSEVLSKAKSRYDQVSARSAEAGIARVLSAGNEGRFAQELEDLGVRVDQDFYRSVLANEHTTVVGAGLSYQGKTRMADFSSPHAGAEVVSRGVSVGGRTQDGALFISDGTSFSAPNMSARMEKIAAGRPFLTPAQREARLKSMAVPFGAPEHLAGAGYVDRLM